MTLQTDESVSPDVVAIAAARAAGDSGRAIDLAIAALGAGRQHPLVLRMVAQGLAEDRRVEDAAALLHRATTLGPDEPESWTAFARMLQRLGRLQEARDAFDKALALAPDLYEAHLGAGAVNLTLGDLPAVRRHYQAAHELAPHEAEPISALAVVAARQGEYPRARELAEAALRLRPDFVAAQIALARADIAEGASDAARGRLTRLLARSDISEDQRCDALYFLGEAFETERRTDEAFPLFGAVGALQARRFGPMIKAAVPEGSLDQARRLAAWFVSAPAEPWAASAGVDREGEVNVAAHVFLLGFPRSGTTLLEQVLGSHPRVAAVEEQAMLAEAGDHFLSSAAGLGRLSRLGAAGADACREVYWRGVREAVGEPLAGRVLIDKLPLNTIRLPLIVRLFPKARILWARRDPRDVVLSCFRQRFRMNTAMFEFRGLEETARYYDAVMRLAEVYRARLPLDLRVVRHEDFVADFETQTRETLAWLGLEWDPAVLNFAERARLGSNTPSARQVAQGLNTRGLGRWRAYEKQMRPVLPALEPWVEAFGYPASPPAERADPRLGGAIVRAEGAARAGDLASAFSIAAAALDEGLDHPFLRRLRAVHAQQEGRLQTAIADFEQALAETPGDWATLSALGLCLARAGRHEDALVRLETALALSPGTAAIHFNRAWTLEAMGELEAARLGYEQAARLDPSHAQALGHLAVLAARRAEWPAARDVALRALAADPAQPAAFIALAQAEAAEGDAGEAERRLVALLQSDRPPPPHERAVALGVLGDVLDARGEAARAFRAYADSADIFQGLHAGRFRETTRVLVARLTAFFQAADPADWRRDRNLVAEGGAAGHVFLVGFPRSGTTMLGQALALAPGVVTLDERDTLRDSVAAFTADAAALARLPTLGEAELEPYRALYWRRVREGGAAFEGRVLVDKLPMNTLGLPLIARLFPTAKILFLRRDPRDTVLSCFRRRFAIDPTTVEFLGLERATQFYDAVMRLADLYFERLELDLRIQRFEDLVGDFETQTRAICAFLGLPWSPAMADFSGRAGAVVTPSGPQLARGLNAEGVGHWRAYRAPLAPVLPVLDAWAARFGYPAD